MTIFFRSQNVVFAGLLFSAALSGAIQSRLVAAEQTNPSGDPKAEFEEVFGYGKKLIADLTVLQAQYQQPKADRLALAALFDEKQKLLRAATPRVEAAAIALLKSDPNDLDARVFASGSMAAALKETDDPQRVLSIAEQLDEASAADGETCLYAASACIILSRLSDAEAWLRKAEANGLKGRELEGLRATAERDRPKVAAEMAKREAEAAADDLPRVKISTSAGDLVVELFENEAPNTVANFINLVEKGFYDKTPFHRVIPGFMAQGGDPTGTGTGGPGYAIACECGEPGARLHFRGTLSMAHAGKDTGGSQFFLTFRPTEHLDGKHTVFGRVIEGDDVLAKIARTQDAQGQPVPGIEPSTIIKAEVVRKRDHVYAPQTLPDPKG